jgi:hypothetical protein
VVALSPVPLIANFPHVKHELESLIGYTLEPVATITQKNLDNVQSSTQALEVGITDQSGIIGTLNHMEDRASI